MPGLNLTRDEAADRSRLITVEHYAVDLDLSGTASTFASTTTVTFSCTTPGGSTFADFVAASVTAITLNGRALDPDLVYAESRITLDGLRAHNALTVHAECSYTNTGEGLHRFLDPADGRTYLYSQLGPANARRVFADFEQPDLKAVFELTVTAPADWVVVANAPVADRRSQPHPASTIGSAGVPSPVQRTVWRFAPTALMSTYLVAVVAGPYHHVHEVAPGRAGAIPLGLYCRQSLAAHLDSDELFTITRQGFAFYEDRFDHDYPFGKYDQLFVPEFNWGAVENIGCVTFRDELLFRSRQLASAYEARANVVLHEMAHMWFGDLVTMRWWDDVWLNESFAEWAGHWASVGATRYTDAWVNVAARKNWAYRADQLPSTHPIAADIADLEAAETSFDGITYAKGAAALRQLVAWVGEPEFLAGLHLYFAEHAFGNADAGDLLRALEESSGRDLSDWAARWLRTTGVDTLRPVVAVDAAGAYSSFAVEASTAGGGPGLRPHRLAVGLFDLTAGKLQHRTGVECDVTGARTEIGALVGIPAADLVLVNDGDLTYAKVRFDPRSLDTLRARTPDIADPLARSLAWTALWDMTRDAELAGSSWVRTVLAGLGAETKIAAMALLLRQGGAAVEGFVAPAHRGGLRAEWTAGLRRLLADAAPGSDRQLALVRAFTTGLASDADLRLLEGLYDGSVVLGGLDLDVDLRWSVLIALARAGRAGAAVIDAELARDPTITGREHAATALAARPDAAAKEAAWRDAVEREDIANSVQLAIIDGFLQPGQEDVLRPYLGRYLATAAAVWSARPAVMAMNILQGLFPRYLPAAEIVGAVGNWLSGGAGGPATRRLVTEGWSDAVRDLAAQEFDALPTSSTTGR